jgi:hypothetical protein
VGGDVYVAPDARKHRVREEDMLHALDHPIRVFDLDDGLTMVVGADPAGRLLEVEVVEGDRGLVIVHAMPARQKFLR